MEVDIEASLEELEHAIQQRLGIMIEQQRLIVLGAHKASQLGGHVPSLPLGLYSRKPQSSSCTLCASPRKFGSCCNSC